MQHNDMFTLCYCDMQFWGGWNIKKKKNDMWDIFLPCFYFFIFLHTCKSTQSGKKIRKPFSFLFMGHQSSGTQKYTLIEEWPVYGFTC